MPFERIDDSRNIGVEARELSIPAPKDGVARAHLLDRFVAEVEQRHHAFFQWHGDAKAAQVEALDHSVQFVRVRCFERQVDRVSPRHAKGGVLHAW